MEYKEAQIVIEKIVKNFCLRFNVFHLYKDLKSAGNLCYVRCREKFKGGDFKKYFISALRNELYKFLKKELRYEGLKVNMEKIEGVSLKNQGNVAADFSLRKLKITKFIENLNEREREILTLFSENYNLKEISEILNFPYERVKDIWSDIKKKAGRIGRSRKDVRREWFKENRGYIREYLKNYYPDWKSRNPEYFKEYFRVNRLIKKRGKIEDYLRKILEIFCLGGKEFGIEKKSKCLCLECLICSNGGCFSIVSHTDFLERGYVEGCDFIFLFSQLRALGEIKGMEGEIKNKRSFVGKNLIFISENLSENFNLIKSSGKRFFMLIRIKK